MKEYNGKKKSELPTPAFLVDRRIFKQNSERMLANSKHLKAAVRALVKTHKTIEGTRLQLGSGDLKTKQIVVSTLPRLGN